MIAPMTVARPTPRPRAVELVGPAGSGKSTLLRLLVGEAAGVQAALPIAPARYLRTAWECVPVFIRLHVPWHGVKWTEMKRVVYVCTCARLLAGPALASRTMVFDEGPVYMLSRARTRGLRPPTGAFDRWWWQALRDLSGRLDMVVWLDAPNRVLRERFEARGKPPIANPDPAVLDAFLDAYRTTYSMVLRQFESWGRPAVRVYDTSQATPVEIADALRATWDAVDARQ